jgi:hypothetical protein
MRTATTFIAQVPEIAPGRWRIHYDSPSGLAFTASCADLLRRDPDDIAAIDLELKLVRPA